MKLLFLTTKFPYPPDEGGKIDTFSNLKILARDYQVLLLYVGGKNKNEQKLKRKTGVEEIYNFPKKTSSDILGIVKNILSPIPYTLSKYYNNKAYKKISDIIRKRDIKIVFLDHLHMAFYGMRIKKDFLKVKLVLREHNVEYIFWERVLKEEKNILKKLFFYWQAKKILRYEKEIVKCFDKCLLISAIDEKNLKRICPEADTIVLPTSLDLQEYPLPQKDKIIPYSLICVGNFSWLPNSRGVLWFLRKVWPRIKKEFPSAKFFIVGKNPPRELVKEQNESVIVTGYVEDVKSWVKKSEIFIAPLFFGGGIRIKILEAMAMAKPIISTSMGAEGIEIRGGQDMLIVDNKEEFVDKIKLLFNNPELRETLSRNARKQIEALYSLDIKKTKLRQGIDQPSIH